MIKYIFTPDHHVGFERKNKHLVPLHDEKAIKAMLKFAQDFKPDVMICGGDNLDCGPVSHWLKHKKASVSGLNLKKDCEVYTELVLKPINKIMAGKRKIWMIGNHEMWLQDAVEENPAFEDMLDVRNLLNLEGWEIKEQGEHVKLGHLRFIHGDTLPNVKNIASVAVDRYNCSVLLGHFHTHQNFLKHTMLENQPLMGTVVPGLCRRNPNYAENRPNQWTQGFAFGYVYPDGQFTNYVPIIINGRFMANGKDYCG